jgi:dTDP-4-dehydrorhamnose reductase
MLGIFGGGQVGQHLAQAADAARLKYDLVGRQGDHKVKRFRNENVKFDFSNCTTSELEKLASNYDAIIYTTAYRDVNACEKDYMLAGKLNHLIPTILSRVTPLIYISTDYVFGKLNAEYERPVQGKIGEGEDPDSKYFSGGSASRYGQTKRHGELSVMANSGSVVRIASPFGLWPSTLRPSFVDTMRFKDGTLTLPDDQIISPTYLPEVAPEIVGLLYNDHPHGVYHAVSEGQVSYAEFVRQIRRESGVTGKVVGRRSDETDSLRPTFSALQNNRMDKKFSHWAEALHKYMRGYK